MFFRCVLYVFYDFYMILIWRFYDLYMNSYQSEGWGTDYGTSWARELPGVWSRAMDSRRRRQLDAAWI